MNDTEEEQIEALKKWWVQNGRAIIVGVVIGVGAIGGWRVWQTHQAGQSQAASVVYETLVDEFDKGDNEQVNTLLESLKSDYASTPYAALASLLNAKLAVNNKDLDAASDALRWTMENSPEDDLRTIARLRLSRVLSAQSNHKDALDLLNGDFPEVYTVLIEELKGDMLVAQGNLDLAREAYSRAMLAGDQPQRNTSLLKMKLDDLAAAIDDTTS